MAISDIFSTSFLFSISIIIILIGGIFAYVSYRIGEQDHKLNSMIGLISTMAEESHFFRSKLSTLQQKIDLHGLPVVDQVQYASQMMGGNQEELIDVSDDDDDDDDDGSDDSNGSDDGSDDGTDGGSDDDETDNEIEDHQIKVLKINDINLENVVIEEDDPNDHINNLFDSNKIIQLEEPIDLKQEDINLTYDEHKEMNISGEEISFLKNISITDLGEEEETSHKTDYKKMSINKLREVIVNRGIVNDASKLKKNEMLKLLGDE